MICSLNQSFNPLHDADVVSPQEILPSRRESFLLAPGELSLEAPACVVLGRGVWVFEPGEPERRDLFKCEAYEADKSQPIDAGEAAGSEVGCKVKIGAYFATWWALNVVFNIHKKKVLNAFPYPWLTSTLSLAAGSLIMLVSWATRIAESPKTDLKFWKTLLPGSGFSFPLPVEVSW